MKKLLCIITIILTFAGCIQHNTKKDKESANTGTINSGQKKDCIAKKRSESPETLKNSGFQVSGTIFYKKMWCGGVQINPKDNSYKSKPFVNKKVWVIKGIVNSDTCTRLQELTTNSHGEFTFEAKPGQYGLIIEDWKQLPFKMRSDNIEDKAMIGCLRKKHKEPDLIVQVTDKPVGNLVYTVIGYCPGGNVCNPMGGNNRP